MLLRMAGLVWLISAVVAIVVPASFTAFVVGSLALSAVALLIGATRPDDEWTTFRSSPTRMAKLSMLWSAIAMVILGFAGWIMLQHPSATYGWRLANAGRGVPVFLGLLGLAATFSIGTMLAELLPRSA